MSRWKGLLPQQTIFMFDNVLVDGRALACLLPYGKSGQGEEVKVNYKSRLCSNCPDQQEANVEEALLEVIKNAVESVMGGVKVESSPDSVKFTSDGLEISGSEYLVKIDKSREIEDLLD
ncbi:3239_t:CDS:2 [Funneliformis geosporum]|uniref:3239_t:CDS:1 n=1 Tax=Funneliformis geosporum TaxID=1117311 RepID=A0A9W4T419_9GLOM|nr:3239_t:CDS:2 [Funneliformis geosporum]